MRLTRQLSRRTVALALAAFALACSGGTDPDEKAADPVSLIVATRGSAIVTMNLDGTGQREYTGLTPVAQYGLHPAWASANGPLLVHTVTQAGGSGVRIHAVDRVTGNVTRLSPSSSPLAHEWYPRVSGSWVYFMGETSQGTFETWRMRTDGTEMAKVPATSPAYGNYYRPMLSPDGGKLAVSTVVDGTIGVRTFAASGGGALSQWIAGATAPRWSPDSRQVAMSTPGGGVIRVMNADGSGLRAVSQDAFDEWFDWTADGKWIVAADDAGLVLVSVADGTLQRVGNTAGMWQPAVVRAPGLD